MGTQAEIQPENTVVKISLEESDAESVAESDWHYDSDSECTDNETHLKTDGAVLAVPLPAEHQTTYGNIAVQNSTVHFGKKTVYQGPVTLVKQFYGAQSLGAPGTPKGSPGSAHRVNNGFVVDSSDNVIDKINVNNNKDNSVITNGTSVNISGNGGAREYGHGVKGAKWFQKTWGNPRSRTAIVATMTITVTFTILLLVVFLTIGTSSIGSTLLTQGDKLRFVSRLEWVAQPPAEAIDALDLPSNRVIITHTATENCTDQASCIFHVRVIQTFHMESKHWSDIAYNFLVGGDGSIYEGRGWDYQGAHTKGFNVKSVGIAFIGTFNSILPPERQLNACRKLIEQGVQKNKLAADYKLFGHRQLIPSLSPGEVLFNEIKTWPHWSSTL